MLKLYPYREDYQSQVIDNVYDKRRVEILNETGTVKINANASGYYKSFFS